MYCIAGKFSDLASSLKLTKFNSSPNFPPFMYTVLLSMVLRKYLKKV